MTHEDDKPTETTTATTTTKDRFKGWIQVGLVFGVLAFGLLVNRVLSNTYTAPQIQASASSVETVDVVQPLVRDTQIRLNETGTVQVRNSIDLSPQVSGRVISVNPALAS
ncbi:MAG: hypothetical protein AAFP81_15375, partial [Pseudomonadota bacterium]